MSKLQLSGKALNDVMKVVFVASQYPDKDIKGVAETFNNMSPIDFNAACWRAQDCGYIFIDKVTGKIDVLEIPEKWEFGEAVDHLIETTPYVLQKLAAVEADPEENFYANYVAGYVGFDVIIAIKYMLENNIMASYEVKDVSKLEDGREVTDTYLFYCLPENVEKRWGENQFKDQEKLQK